MPVERPGEAVFAFFGQNLSWGRFEEPHGRYVYNSWAVMEMEGAPSPVACRYNDFALIEIDARFARSVSPTVDGWAGPNGTAENQVEGFVYTTGGTILRTSPGLQDWAGLPPAQEATRDRWGLINPHRVAPQGAGEWSQSAYFPGLCVPGDSGSPVLDSAGRALGAIHAMVAANALGCEFALLEPALAYMRDAAGIEFTLVNGQTPFRPSW